MHELAARLDQADRIIGKMQRAISIILTDVTRWVRIASAGVFAPERPRQVFGVPWQGT
jgi:hypothetical protein